MEYLSIAVFAVIFLVGPIGLFATLIIQIRSKQWNRKLLTTSIIFTVVAAALYLLFVRNADTLERAKQAEARLHKSQQSEH